MPPVFSFLLVVFNNHAPSSSRFFSSRINLIQLKNSSEANIPPYDLDYLRKAIALAAENRRSGNSPFGALLVDSEGRLLLEAQNNVFTGRDSTGHAETNLVRKASAAYSREFLSGCTVYTSTEPCAMCAAAIFWSGVGRVVYGLSERDMVAEVKNIPSGDFLDLPCREVFAHGGRQIEVLGPLLEEEARQVHIGFW